MCAAGPGGRPRDIHFSEGSLDKGNALLPCQCSSGSYGCFGRARWAFAHLVMTFQEAAAVLSCVVALARMPRGYRGDQAQLAVSSRHTHALCCWAETNALASARPSTRGRNMVASHW